MAITTFVADTILTAAQMNALQANDYNQTVSTKTASYTLVAADKGTKVVMNSASATTITVNTSLFAAGDNLTLLNIGAGVCTVTAGTATVSTTGSLALAQYGGGTLYFTSAGVSVFQANGVTAAASAVAQVKTAVVTAPSTISVTTATFADTPLTITFTPTSASNLVFITGQISFSGAFNGSKAYRLMRGSTAIGIGDASSARNRATGSFADTNNTNDDTPPSTHPFSFIDSPATTSATTYKLQVTTLFAGATISFNRGINNTDNANYPTAMSSITCMEVTP